MNYAFLIFVAVISAVASGFAFFWVGHEHGVRSSEYYKRRLELLAEKKHPLDASGNVRLIYEPDTRS